jgi:hypothetical protein
MGEELSPYERFQRGEVPSGPGGDMRIDRQLQSGLVREVEALAAKLQEYGEVAALREEVGAYQDLVVRELADVMQALGRVESLLAIHIERSEYEWGGGGAGAGVGGPEGSAADADGGEEGFGEAEEAAEG